MDDTYVYSTYLKDILVKNLNYFKEELQLGIYSTTCQLYHNFFKNGPKDYDPFIICCSAMYLSCKVEEAPVRAHRLVELLKVGNRPDVVTATISNEIYLLEVLDFNIYMDSPFHGLKGILMELKCYSLFPEGIDHQRSFDESVRFIQRALLINTLVLEYSMSQIACAALFTIYGENICRNYLSTVSPDTMDALIPVLSRIQKVVGEFDVHKSIAYDIPAYEIGEEISQI